MTNKKEKKKETAQKPRQVNSITDLIATLSREGNTTKMRSGDKQKTALLSGAKRKHTPHDTKSKESKKPTLMATISLLAKHMASHSVPELSL